MLSSNDQKKQLADKDEQSKANQITIIRNRLDDFKRVRENRKLDEIEQEEYDSLKKNYKKQDDEIQYEQARNQQQPIQVDYDYIKQNFEFEPIPGDGNCFYAAVGCYLNIEHEILRKKTVKTIENHIGKFFYAIEGTYKESVNFNKKSYSHLDIKIYPLDDKISRYLAVAKQDKIYVDNIEIQAFVKKYKRPIVILYDNRPPEIVKNWHQKVNEDHLPIFVCHNSLQNYLAHYNVLLPKKDVNLIEIYNHIAQNNNVRYQQPDEYLHVEVASDYEFIESDSESEEENLANKQKYKKLPKKQKDNTPKKLWKRLQSLENKLKDLEEEYRKEENKYSSILSPELKNYRHQQVINTYLEAMELGNAIYLTQPWSNKNINHNNRGKKENWEKKVLDCLSSHHIMRLYYLKSFNNSINDEQLPKLPDQTEVSVEEIRHGKTGFPLAVDRNAETIKLGSIVPVGVELGSEIDELFKILITDKKFEFLKTLLGVQDCIKTADVVAEIAAQFLKSEFECHQNGRSEIFNQKTRSVGAIIKKKSGSNENRSTNEFVKSESPQERKSGSKPTSFGDKSFTYSSLTEEIVIIVEKFNKNQESLTIQTLEDKAFLHLDINLKEKFQAFLKVTFIHLFISKQEILSSKDFEEYSEKICELLSSLFNIMYLLEIKKDIAKDLELFFLRVQELNEFLEKKKAEVIPDKIFFKIQLMHFIDQLLGNKTIFDESQRLITNNKEITKNEKFNTIAKSIFNFSCTLAEERITAEFEQAKKENRINNNNFSEKTSKPAQIAKHALDYTKQLAEIIQLFLDEHIPVSKDILNIFELKLVKLHAYIKALNLLINDNQVARIRLGHVAFTFNCILHWACSNNQTIAINYLDPKLYEKSSEEELAEDYGKDICPWLFDYTEKLDLISFQYNKYTKHENNANKILSTIHFYSENLQILRKFESNQFDYSKNINEIKACLLYLYQSDIIGKEIKITENLNKALCVNGIPLENYISEHKNTITKILNKFLSSYSHHLSQIPVISSSAINEVDMFKMIQVGFNLVDVVHEIETQYGWNSKLVYALTSANFDINTKYSLIANKLAELLGFNLDHIKKDEADNEILKKWQDIFSHLQLFFNTMHDLCNGNPLTPEKEQSFTEIFMRLLDTNCQKNDLIVNDTQIRLVYIEVLIHYARTVIQVNDKVLTNLRKELSIGFLKSEIHRPLPSNLSIGQEKENQKITSNTRGRSVRNLWRKPSSLNIEEQNKNMPGIKNVETLTSLENSSSTDEKPLRRKRNKKPTPSNLVKEQEISGSPGFFKKRDIKAKGNNHIPELKQSIAPK